MAPPSASSESGSLFANPRLVGVTWPISAGNGNKWGFTITATDAPASIVVDGDLRFGEHRDRRNPWIWCSSELTPNVANVRLMMIRSTPEAEQPRSVASPRSTCPLPASAGPPPAH